MSAIPLITQLWVDGGYVTFDSYAQDGWSTQIGPDPESGTQPNKLTFALASDDYSMDPSEPTSPLNGKIGRNTMARLRVNSTTLAVGEVASWEPDHTVEHRPGVRGKSWVDVTAEGLLRRLGRWTDPLASAMTRQTSSVSGLIGFWPIEDGSDADSVFQAASVAAGNATFSGEVDLAGDDGAGGSDKLAVLGPDGRITGTFATSTGDGYQIAWAAKLATMPASLTYLDVMTWRDGDGRVWEWMVNLDRFRILVTSGTGTVLYDATTAFTGREPTNYLRYRMKVTVSAGTITIEPAWYVQDDPSPAGYTDTFAGTTARRPRQWTLAGNTYMDQAAVGHVFATTDTTANLLTGSARDSFNGYLGELCSWRYYRLLTEEGLTASYIGSFLETRQMGRQRPAPLLELLEEAVRTDGGLLHDWNGGIGLQFRMYNSIIGQSPALTVAKSQLSPGLRKRIDDVGTANDITGENWDGTKYRTEQLTGRMSTQPPPAGQGRTRGSVDLSLRYLEDLVQRTEFERLRNTVDRPRYPSITIDLLGEPTLRAAITALRPGDLVSVTGLEAQAVLLIAMTIRRSGDGARDTAVLDCLPADVFVTGLYDSSVARYDLRTCTLAADRTSSQTSWTVNITDDEAWSTTSTPYAWMVAGEKVTVTAMGARTGTAGAYQQVATVVRGVNGVVKDQRAGAEIHVFDQKRWGLR